jgi:hypothetical protein
MPWSLRLRPSPVFSYRCFITEESFRKAGARRELKGAPPNEEPFRHGGFGSRNSSPQSL